MSPSGAEVIRQIKQQVREVDPAEVSEHLGNGVTLIDVRETEEWDRGHIPGAVHVPRGYLESRIDGAVADRDAPVVLYCASGQRSALAAHTLTELLGYSDVRSMTGGITLWKDRGYKVEVPTVLTPRAEGALRPPPAPPRDRGGGPGQAARREGAAARRRRARLADRALPRGRRRRHARHRRRRRRRPLQPPAPGHPLDRRTIGTPKVDSAERDDRGAQPGREGRQVPRPARRVATSWRSSTATT